VEEALPQSDCKTEGQEKDAVHPLTFACCLVTRSRTAAPPATPRLSSKYVLTFFHSLPISGGATVLIRDRPHERNTLGWATTVYEIAHYSTRTSVFLKFQNGLQFTGPSWALRAQGIWEQGKGDARSLRAQGIRDKEKEMLESGKSWEQKRRCRYAMVCDTIQNKPPCGSTQIVYLVRFLVVKLIYLGLI
jgi:hypothetical protein